MHVHAQPQQNQHKRLRLSFFLGGIGRTRTISTQLAGICVPCSFQKRSRKGRHRQKDSLEPTVTPSSYAWKRGRLRAISGRASSQPPRNRSGHTAPSVVRFYSAPPSWMNCSAAFGRFKIFCLEFRLDITLTQTACQW